MRGKLGRMVSPLRRVKRPGVGFKATSSAAVLLFFSIKGAYPAVLAQPASSFVVRRQARFSAERRRASTLLCMFCLGLLLLLSRADEGRLFIGLLPLLLSSCLILELLFAGFLHFHFRPLPLKLLPLYIVWYFHLVAR